MRKTILLFSMIFLMLCAIPCGIQAADNGSVSFSGENVTFTADNGSIKQVNDGAIRGTADRATKNADGIYWKTKSININTYKTVSTTDKEGMNVFFYDFSGSNTDKKTFIGANLKANAKATIEVSETTLTDNKITIKGTAGDAYNVFVCAKQPTRNTYITMLLRGTQWSDTLSVEVKDGYIQLSGANDVEVTLDNPTIETAQITTYTADLPNAVAINLDGFISSKDYHKITSSTAWELYVADECDYNLALSSLNKATTSASIQWSSGKKANFTIGSNKLVKVTENGDITISSVWQNPFTDIQKKDWFYSAVSFANTRSIFDGSSATKFAPDEAMTRGMLVTVLWRMCGKPLADERSNFTDIKYSDWYSESVAWAYQYGITNGISNTMFAPNDPVTREQLVTLVDRFLINIDCNGGYTWNSTGPLKYLKSYTDFRTISDYANNSMAWAVHMGIIKGYTGNLLSPQNHATRAEVATIIERIYFAYPYFYSKENTMTPSAPYAKRPGICIPSPYNV